MHTVSHLETVLQKQKRLGLCLEEIYVIVKTQKKKNDSNQKL